MPNPPSHDSELHPTPRGGRVRWRRFLSLIVLPAAVATCVSEEHLAPRPALQAAAQAVELLQNGDFEAGTVAWQNSDSVGRALDGSRVHGGLLAQRILASGLTDHAVYQEVPVTAGATYAAAGWLATDSLAGTGATFELLWLDTLGLSDTIPPAHLLGSDVVGVATGSQDWTSLTGTFTAPAGSIGARVQLRVALEPGDTGSAVFDDLSLTLPPDVTPPTVALTAPLPGATVQHTITLQADATDNGLVAGVQFQVDGIAVGVELTAAPYTLDYNTDTLVNGPHALSAVARDTAGNTATATPVDVVVANPAPPDVTPPTVVLTAPLPGATVQHTITLQADATDDGLVAGVQFQVNGIAVGAEVLIAPYALSYSTDTLVNGSHTVSAVARDTAGNAATSAAISIVVANPPPRDVIVILTDDQRFDQMPYMPLTSALLNAETVRFSRGFVTTSVCCPSRSSVLTGLYAHNHGVWTNSLPNGGAAKFDPTSTLATWLHQAGYRTALIGKYFNQYDLISPAIPPGWDQFQALTYTTLQYYNYDINDNGTIVRYGSAPADYVTDVLTNRAVQFIQGSPARQPIFLLYTPTAPHAPSTPAPGDAGRYASFRNWRPASFNEADVSDKPNWVKSLPKLSASKIASDDAFHRSQLESLQAADRGVVTIVTALQQAGRWNNTLLIFLSDNGYMWGEHRLANRKACPYEECIRVPFWVRAPGLIARTDTNLVANIDLAPTIAAWAGVTIPTKVNGKDLLPLLQNPGTAWRTSLLIEHLASGSTATNSSGVRTPRYLYNEYENGNKELYDLVTDPLQLTSVASKASNAALVASLKATLNALKLE